MEGASNVVIETYSKGREDDVAFLLRECFQSYRRYNITVEEWLKYHERDPGVKPENTFIAYVNGKPAGLVQVVERKVKIVGEVSIDVAGIANVCVHPSYRGLGLSRETLAKVHEYYSNKGFIAAGLLAGYGSLAHSVYERLGYVNILHIESLMLSINDVSFISSKMLCGSKWSTKTISEEDLDVLMKLYSESTRELTGVIVRDRDYWVKKILHSHPLHTFFYSSIKLEYRRLILRDNNVRGYVLLHSWREEPRLLEPGKALIKEIYAMGNIYDYASILLTAIQWLREKVKPRSIVVYSHLAKELRDTLGVGIVLGCGEVYMFKPLKIKSFAEKIAKALNSIAEKQGLPKITLLVDREYFGEGDHVVEVNSKGLVKLAFASNITDAVIRGWINPRGNFLLLKLLLQSIKPYINYIDRW